ncbi:MAG: dihydrofolate reductase [Phaeodactylibacter sp.]|nr:dihydrofolate reductase [Phaeodactylibacter sp.]MCB9265572.1 dihydrofolate reductase [Lewinellaceae bacterium]MCB9288468.1 dihydrofolate reductase [Lewinellaceae bacterium]
MEKVIIVAKSDNNVIGRNGALPWQMPADLAFFSRQIKGCYLLSGRKSYESAQGKEIFSNRPFVILTRRKGFQPEEGKAAHSLEEGISTAEADGAKRLCILGGEEVYRQALKVADKLIITEIHTEIENGNAFFPDINFGHWKEYKREDHKKDRYNPYDFSFVFYIRVR